MWSVWQSLLGWLSHRQLQYIRWAVVCKRNHRRNCRCLRWNNHELTVRVREGIGQTAQRVYRVRTWMEKEKGERWGGKEDGGLLGAAVVSTFQRNTIREVVSSVGNVIGYRFSSSGSIAVFAQLTYQTYKRILAYISVVINGLSSCALVHVCFLLLLLWNRGRIHRFDAKCHHFLCFLAHIRCVLKVCLFHFFRRFLDFMLVFLLNKIFFIYLMIVYSLIIARISLRTIRKQW